MAGIRDTLLYIPPILLASCSISNPTTTLAEARILGSTDPTYGTYYNNWLPRRDGKPFALITTSQAKFDYPETNREWVTYTVNIFIAIDHAQSPALIQNYDDLANAWADALSDTIPTHQRLDNAQLLLVPQPADILWLADLWNKRPSYRIFNVDYAGIEMTTSLRVVRLLNYQP